MNVITGQRCHRRAPANASNQKGAPPAISAGGGGAERRHRRGRVALASGARATTTAPAAASAMTPRGSYEAVPLILVVYGHLEPARGWGNNQTTVIAQACSNAGILGVRFATGKGDQLRSQTELHGCRGSAGCWCSASPSVGSPDCERVAPPQGVQHPAAMPR